MPAVGTIDVTAPAYSRASTLTRASKNQTGVCTHLYMRMCVRTHTHDPSLQKPFPSHLHTSRHVLLEAQEQFKVVAFEAITRNLTCICLFSRGNSTA